MLPQDVEFLGKKGPKAKALRWPCTTSWESNGSKWHDMGMTGHKTKLGLFKKIQYHNLIFKYRFMNYCKRICIKYHKRILALTTIFSIYNRWCHVITHLIVYRVGVKTSIYHKRPVFQLLLAKSTKHIHMNSSRFGKWVNL